MTVATDIADLKSDVGDLNQDMYAKGQPGVRGIKTTVEVHTDLLCDNSDALDLLTARVLKVEKAAAKAKTAVLVTEAEEKGKKEGWRKATAWFRGSKLAQGGAGIATAGTLAVGGVTIATPDPHPIDIAATYEAHGGADNPAAKVALLEDLGIVVIIRAPEGSGSGD